MTIGTKSLNAAFLLVFCLFSVDSWAQTQRTIIGTVKDTDGEPLIGANIIVQEDRARGTVADVDGNFSIAVGANATTLLVSYTGFDLLSQNIVGLSVVNITLSTGKALDEVLVIGYGSVKREDATGLVQSVSSERFNKGAITGPQELLAGKIAGVVITTNDGAPGGGAKIRVRGESSLSASNNPLIVIDGVPLDNGNEKNEALGGARNPLSILNPNDIESFTVLKDASAAAIYGNRASAGVILITTKKGALGKKVSVGYTANLSQGQTANRLDVLTADEFRKAIEDNYPEGSKARGLLGNSSTVWQDQIFQKAIGTDHSLSIAGGIGKWPYRVSLGFTDQDGLLKTDHFRRYSTGINLNPKFLDNRLQFVLGAKGQLNENRFANKDALWTSASFDPTKAVRDTAFSEWGSYTTWLTPNGTPNKLAPSNPVALLEQKEDLSTVKQWILNASADYRFKKIPALRANVTVGYDQADGEGTVKTPTNSANAWKAITGGGSDNTYAHKKTNAVFDSYLNYKKDFGEHGLDGMVGYSWQHFYLKTQYRNSDVAGSPSEIDTKPASPREYFLLSMFSRVNYSFRDFLLLTGSVRRDATSRFGPDFRWGNFPAAALAIKALDRDGRYFNFLKARVSVGKTGQQDAGDSWYAYQANYELGQPNASYPTDTGFINTIRPNGYVANFRWEEAVSYNAGLDFSIVKNRIGGSFDLYQKKTYDLLNKVTEPALTNLTNEIVKNIGEMSTKGVEFSLNLTPVQKGKITWDVAANTAFTKNKITKLTLNDDPKYIGVRTGGISGGVGSNIQIHSVGYAPNSFFVYHQLYGSDGKILEGKFEDLNGDTIINDLDRYRFNQSAPRWTFGLTSNLSVGNFDFSFAGRANFGNWAYNNVQTDQGFLSRLYWSSGYLSNINQSAIDLNVKEQKNLTFSDHFVTRADFVRLDHVTAGYTFRKVGKAKNLRVYATAQNPKLWTKYEGLDPELGNGIDNNFYPRAKTFLAGLSVNF